MHHLPISIALCTYNGEKYLRELIDSILVQTIQAQEIIIVDDGSSDGTMSILQEYAKIYDFIKLFPQPKNLGPVMAFKMAISLTQFQLIFLADQDDIWKPNKIEKMVSKVGSLDQTLPLVIYSDLEMINEKGETVNPSFWEMSDLSPARTTFKNLMYNNVVTGSASMVNDKMKEEIKKTPKGVIMHDHWIGLIAYGFGQYLYTEEKLVKYRIHPNSVTKKESVNTLWRIKNQIIQLLNPQKNFLDKEIIQMEQYSDLYLGHLSPSDQRALSKFLSLKRKNFFQKKLYSISHKIMHTQ